MCKSPDVPPPPPPLQDAKLPDSAALKDRERRNRAATPASTVLTGPAGIGAAPTARATLLGQ